MIRKDNLRSACQLTTVALNSRPTALKASIHDAALKSCLEALRSIVPRPKPVNPTALASGSCDGFNNPLVPAFGDDYDLSFHKLPMTRIRDVSEIVAPAKTPSRLVVVFEVYSSSEGKIKYQALSMKTTTLLSWQGSEGDMDETPLPPSNGKGKEWAGSAALSSPWEDYFTFQEKEVPANAGLGLFGSKIVLAGGLEPCDYGDSIRVIYCNCQSDFFYELDMAGGDGFQLNDARMCAGKLQPFISEIKGKLYVLTRYNFARPDYHFEVCHRDSASGLLTWVNLWPPSCYFSEGPAQKNSMLLHFPYISYLVFGPRIYVSNPRYSNASFYEVTSKDLEEAWEDTWQQSTLFGEGQPLPFRGRAALTILYDPDYPGDGVVLAYDGGRLSMYAFFNWVFKAAKCLDENVFPPGVYDVDEYCNCHFLSLGAHKFCLLLSTDELTDFEPPALIFTFVCQVTRLRCSKKEEMGHFSLMKYERVSRHEYSANFTSSSFEDRRVIGFFGLPEIVEKV